MEDNKQVLNIAFFHPERRWIYTILGKLDSTQRKKYSM